MGGGWGGRLFEVGANSRLGAYSNKYGSSVPGPFQAVQIVESRLESDER